MSENNSKINLQLHSQINPQINLPPMIKWLGGKSEEICKIVEYIPRNMILILNLLLEVEHYFFICVLLRH